MVAKNDTYQPTSGTELMAKPTKKVFTNELGKLDQNLLPNKGVDASPA